MVDFYCAESLSLSSKQAYPDPVMFSQSAGYMAIDEEETTEQAEFDCLQSLCTIENMWSTNSNYFESDFQPDLKPYMRKMVVEWLLEVCKEQHCEDEVFPVTVNLLDRFLAVQHIRKTEFQLLASACLLVASKLRETASLPAEKICKYTENSISVEQLYAFEMFVLDRLQWDLGAVTAHEMADHMMYRLFSDPTAIMFTRIRRHCRALLDLSQTDFSFALQPPSLLAASAILSSLAHFGFADLEYQQDDNTFSIFQQVGELVGTDAEFLCQWSILITRLRDSFVAQHQEMPVPQSPASDSGVSGDDTANSFDQSDLSESSVVSVVIASSNSKPAPSSELDELQQQQHPQTPTDVAELYDE